jgi:putative endonuclease
MKNLNKELGCFGEELAASYLEKQNYQILEKNYRLTLGEIDIIAFIEKTIVFVEVKTRKTLCFGLPCEAVTAKKRHKIYIIAEYYISNKNLYNFNCRFDIIEVYIQNKESKINHLINAFWI